MKRTISLFLFFTFIFSNSYSQDGWKITTTDTANYNPGFLGNGYIGIRTNKLGLKTNEVYINGMYDCEPGGFPNFISYYKPFDINVNIKGKGELCFDKNVSKWQQALNLKEGILFTNYNYAGVVSVHNKMMALRSNPMCAMNYVEFQALEDIEITIENKVDIPDRSDVMGIYNSLLEFKSFQGTPVMYTLIPTLSGKDCIAGANTYYFSSKAPQLVYSKTSSTSQKVSFDLALKKGQKYTFCIVGSYTHSGFTNDPLNDALRACGKEYNKGYQPIIDQHKIKWAELWQSDIEIEGDVDAQRDVRLALYSLYSSITEGSGLSIPPCGLSNDSWGAHIFWDAELWMFPPLLVMQPTFAKSMLDFRINTTPQCKKRASQFGYKGIMFPWESDMYGNECCPVSYKLDMNEHHVTADIGIAFWNYYLVTQDKEWLQTNGYPMLKDIADFWASRSTVDSLGNYHILNVIGPDEYHENVDDNAFTNGAAKACLKAAGKAAQILNEKPSPLWQKISDGLVIINTPEGHTLQYKGYKGEMIKQADVNLLAYPLNIIINKTQVLKDINYYEPKIDDGGPAMSHSVLATIYARYGDVEKAYSLFCKSYQPNRRTPFYFISESSVNAGRMTFCTGYGGMLQTIIYGFGGLKITESGIVKESQRLPKKWKKLTIKVNGKSY